MPAARADDACAAFTWNVEHERTLFSAEAQSAVAGTTTADAPNLSRDRLYGLQLKAQAEVKFVVPPGGKKPAEATYAGLARVAVDAAGVYRVALDQKLWVDAIVNGAAVQPVDFQGRPGCNAPHKIVEFLLPAGMPVTIQLSGASGPSAKLTVTRTASGEASDKAP